MTIDVKRLREFADRVSKYTGDGWEHVVLAGTSVRGVTLGDLSALLDVYEAACKMKEADLVAIELGDGAVEARSPEVYKAVADLYDAVDKARGGS